MTGLHKRVQTISPGDLFIALEQKEKGYFLNFLQGILKQTHFLTLSEHIFLHHGRQLINKPQCFLVSNPDSNSFQILTFRN
jgi:hypothetical protein